jgi:hypothetical protein
MTTINIATLTSNELAMALDETITTSKTSEGWDQFFLADGIVITRIDSSLFTEDGVEDWVESMNLNELETDIAYFRSLAHNSKVGA